MCTLSFKLKGVLTASRMKKEGFLLALVAKEGCAALSNFADLPAGQPAAIEAGALTTITSAMTKHKFDDHIALSGCWALGNIAHHAIVDLEAVTSALAAIISSCAVHSRVAAVASRGCWALSKIVAGSDARTHAALLLGAPAAVNAMRANTTSADVALHGVDALAALAALLPAGPEALFRASAPAAIVTPGLPTAAALRLHAAG